jgi:hypothetical protein
MEKINKLYMIFGLAIAFGLFFGIAANADEMDEATKMTFSAPVQIPGRVLPAGSYLFKLADTEPNLNMVRIFNADGTKLYGTVETIPAERLEPTGDTTVTLAEQGSGKPDALRTWFYPGRLMGNEFVYPGREEKELTHDAQHTILAGAKTTNAGAQAVVRRFAHSARFE